MKIVNRFNKNNNNNKKKNLNRNNSINKVVFNVERL